MSDSNGEILHDRLMALAFFFLGFNLISMTEYIVVYTEV
jgi:hypothetical protein